MQAAVSYSGSRIPVMEQVFCRNLISLVVAFVLIRKNKLSLFGDKSVQPLLFGRSFFGFVGVISLFYASSHARPGRCEYSEQDVPLPGHTACLCVPQGEAVQGSAACPSPGFCRCGHRGRTHVPFGFPALVHGLFLFGHIGDRLYLAPLLQRQNRRHDGDHALFHLQRCVLHSLLCWAISLCPTPRN